MEPSVLSTFLRPWEVQYYDTFRLRLIPQLRYGHGEFWHRTVMREVARDECVRNAVLALGALGRAHDQCDEDTFFVPWHKKKLEVVNEARGSGMSVPNHYYQALVHHSRALSAFRGLLARSQDRNTPRSILIASLLLIQFEFLQGNTEAADQIGAHCLAVLCHKIMRGSLGCQYTMSTGTINDNTLIIVNNPSDNLEPPRSLIAASIDDEGLAQAEIDLLLKTTFNAAYSALHPRSRKVILDLDLPFLRGPDPPPVAASAATFSATWTRCLTTVALWYYRMQNRMQRTQERHHNHLDADTAQLQDDHRYETGELLDVLGKWQNAVSQRLGSATTTPDEREMYSKAAIAIQGAYYSICTVLDPSSGAWTAYEAATTALLDQCEAIIVATDAAAAGESHRNSKSLEAVEASLPLRDQGAMHESALPVVSQIAQQNRDSVLRRRAMALWSRCVSKERSHWDVLATYLGSRAVMDVEEKEAGRESVAMDGEMPLKKQWFWSGGAWSEDYTEFRAVVSRKVPGLYGSVERRVVVMPVEGRGQAAVLS